MNLINFIVCINAARPSYVVTWVTHLFLLLTFRNPPAHPPTPPAPRGDAVTYARLQHQKQGDEERMTGTLNGAPEWGACFSALVLSLLLSCFSPSRRIFFCSPSILPLWSLGVTTKKKHDWVFIYFFPSTTELTLTLMWIQPLFAPCCASSIAVQCFYFILWVVFIYFLPSMIFVFF